MNGWHTNVRVITRSYTEASFKVFCIARSDAMHEGEKSDQPYSRGFANTISAQHMRKGSDRREAVRGSKIWSLSLLNPGVCVDLRYIHGWIIHWQSWTTRPYFLWLYKARETPAPCIAYHDNNYVSNRYSKFPGKDKPSMDMKLRTNQSTDGRMWNQARQLSSDYDKHTCLGVAQAAACARSLFWIWKCSWTGSES